MLYRLLPPKVKNDHKEKNLVRFSRDPGHLFFASLCRSHSGFVPLAYSRDGDARVGARCQQDMYRFKPRIGAITASYQLINAKYWT
ncbi:hypothetical protein HDF13_001297 [Edaphobacter lichenicola]|uniref:Uncharacterized protein n=1 Tax=Tunturiibacter gelidiferens TaxID=3069689 RepID=A0ACC5NX18_9BACT|nr:hypothetical protein [Edaphobacter lichenicola]